MESLLPMSVADRFRDPETPAQGVLLRKGKRVWGGACQGYYRKTERNS